MSIADFSDIKPVSNHIKNHGVFKGGKLIHRQIKQHKHFNALLTRIIIRVYIFLYNTMFMRCYENMDMTGNFYYFCFQRDNF